MEAHDSFQFRRISNDWEMERVEILLNIANSISLNVINKISLYLSPKKKKEEAYETHGVKDLKVQSELLRSTHV